MQPNGGVTHGSDRATCWVFRVRSLIVLLNGVGDDTQLVVTLGHLLGIRKPRESRSNSKQPPLPLTLSPSRLQFKSIFCDELKPSPVDPLPAGQGTGSSGERVLPSFQREGLVYCYR